MSEHDQKGSLQKASLWVGWGSYKGREMYPLENGWYGEKKVEGEKDKREAKKWSHDPSPMPVSKKNHSREHTIYQQKRCPQMRSLVSR